MVNQSTTEEHAFEFSYHISMLMDIDIKFPYDFIFPYWQEWLDVPKVILDGCHIH